MQQHTEEVFFKDVLQVLIHAIVLDRKHVEQTARKKFKFASLGSCNVTTNELDVIRVLVKNIWENANKSSGSRAAVIEIVGDSKHLLERWTMTIQRAPLQHPCLHYLEQRCKTLQRAVHSTLLVLPSGKKKTYQHGYNIAVNYAEQATSSLKFKDMSKFSLFDSSACAQQRFCNFLITFAVEYEKDLPELTFTPPLKNLIRSSFLNRSIIIPTSATPAPQLTLSQQEEEDPTAPPFARFGAPIPVEDFSQLISQDQVIPYADEYMFQLQHEQQDDAEPVHENIVTKRFGEQQQISEACSPVNSLFSSSMASEVEDQSEVRKIHLFTLFHSWNFHLLHL